MPEPGARYAVRSSASIEDEAGVLAAGLFLSRVDVARGEVLEAVRARARVGAVARPWSRTSPSTAWRTDNLGFAVLIHEFIAGDAGGAAAFDPTRAEPPTIEVHAGKAAAIASGAARAHRGRGARAGQDQRRRSSSNGS